MTTAFTAAPLEPSFSQPTAAGHPLAPAAASASASPPADAIGRGARWTGRVLSGIAALFLLMDGAFKLLATPEARDGTSALGYSPSVLVPLGVVQLLCLAVYLVPRTAVLGAVLWTGYLGGAIATHVRVGNPWASHTLFPVYVALLLWGGLWLRDRRVRAVLPLLGR
jgi:hypothetical protein